MGNYIFNVDTLVRTLEKDASQAGTHDFGRDIIPSLIKSHRVLAYDFLENAVPGIHPYEEWGYWRDVGTMEAYWQANMDVLGKTPIFDLRNVKWPITTDALTDPVASMVRSQMDDAMLGQGSLVIDSTITRSIIGRNVRIGEGCSIEESIILDGTVIGSNCHLQRCIVDRFNVIESGTSLGGDKGRLGKRPSGKLGLTTIARGKSYGGRAISSSSSPT